MVCMFAVLGDVDVCTSMRVCAASVFVFVCVCYFFFSLYKFSIQGRPEKRDNGLGPGWTDDECVHFMTTKA